MLSFTEQDDRTVVVRREKICDNCKRTPPAVRKQADGVTLLQFLDSLSGEEQRAALIHLSVKWAEQQVCGTDEKTMAERKLQNENKSTN